MTEPRATAFHRTRRTVADDPGWRAIVADPAHRRIVRDAAGIGLAVGIYGMSFGVLAVAAGAGVAVLPSSTAERYEVAGVRFVPLEPPVVCEVAVLSRDEDSTTITGFLRLARATAAATRAPVITRETALASPRA